jgi:group I intron endonuclease
MKKSGIYKITNPKGEVYIGCSKDLDKRKNDYKLFKVKTQPLILESLYTYGWVNHIFEILEYTDNLKEREKYWIKKLDSFNNGLNNNRGGGGPETHTEETRKLISEKGKTNKGNRENSHWKGKKYSEQHVINLSLSKKGKPSHWKGKTRSEENKLKISQSKKGKPIPANNKHILQFDKQGNFIKEWPSTRAAKRETGAKNVFEVASGYKNQLYKSSGGFIWKYKE